MTKPTRIPKITRIPAPALGPEDAVITEDGTVYSALRNDGWLLRVRPGGTEAERVCHLGGRGLGVELMGDGRILVCNADLGLQAVDPDTGEVESLLAEIFGEPFGVCNNAAIALDGTIFFTESSRRYRLENYKNDIVEDTRTGRLVRWHPEGGTAEVLLDGLAFANGVALSADERTVFVAETGKGRVHKVNLDDGAPSLFAEVPGYPDNLSRGSDGLIWVAIPAPLNATVQKLHTLPLWLRKFVVRLPEGLQPPIARSCRIMALNEDGLVVHDLEGDPSQYHHVTGVREKDGVVWLGSIYEDALGTFPLRG